MKKIFLGMLVGALILGTVATAMAGPFTWRKQDSKLEFIKVLIVVKLQWGNIRGSNDSREGLKLIGSGLGLIEHLLQEKPAVWQESRIVPAATSGEPSTNGFSY